MSIPTSEYSDLLSYFSNDTTAVTTNILSLALTQLNETHTLTIANISNATAELNMYATATNDSDVALIVTQAAAAAAMYANASANASDYGDGDVNAAVNRSALVVAVGRPRMPTEMPFWLILCYSIIFLFAIIGNLLVISTLIQNRRMRTITNLFLLNLAFSDILLGVFCMPVTLVGTLLRNFIFGEFFCKLIPFSQAISVAVSSWTLVAISCERYYAICHPLRSRTWQTLNHAYRIIGSIWVCSIICMTPIAIFSQLMPTSQGLRKCREQWPADSVAYERSYNIFLDLILLVLPLLILSFAYMLITRTLYVGMQNERAMIFGSVAPIVAGGSGGGAGGLGGISCAAGGGGGGKLCSELETLTTALVPNPATATTANNKKSARRFQFNVSFRVRGRSTCSNNSVDDMDEQQQQQQQQQQQHNAMKKSKSHCRQLQQQQCVMQEQQKQYNEACYDDIVSTQAIATTAVSHKRKLLTATDGRRHLYCMRSGSIKSLNHNNNDRNGGGLGSSSKSTSTSSSMTVINVPQQQRFKLYQQRHQSQQQLHQHQKQQQQQQLQMYMQQDIERSKSTSTPSLRLHDTALRRSNKTKSLESKKRVIKMLFVLVLEFFICWTPLYIINTVAMFIGPVIYEYVGYRWIPFLQLLAYSSSCCNPITYCFMNAGFRRAFLDTFKGIQLSGVLFRRKNSPNNSVAGNSIIMANSGTMMTTNTVLDSPRL
ncbi:uncharacterized protein LOC105213856 [Zeugodacus cucurbitae]|uniref:uncharacterized protein LOC105213856 n=1 Tax=Zeugodacus cucurbitae TaxID=28588 RepID=UPI0023D90048|nr:uncharacterized protein LOC105213856 [Zeugodacus cucurbitae]